MSDRIIEVYAGAYASGKSETSINRARQFAAKGKRVTLVDLDSVEPAYTLRPIAEELRGMGINVITQPDNFGLGEAASYVTPAQINCLAQEGDIIIDVGYGAGGLDILDILTGIDDEENLNIYLVVNTGKFETSTVDNIVEYVDFTRGCGKYEFTGLISNTHFGDETTREDVLGGYEKLKTASRLLNLPIRAIGVEEKLAREFGLRYDGVEEGFVREVGLRHDGFQDGLAREVGLRHDGFQDGLAREGELGHDGVKDGLVCEGGLTYDGVEVWVYKRMMPRAFW